MLAGLRAPWMGTCRHTHVPPAERAAVSSLFLLLTTMKALSQSNLVPVVEIGPDTMFDTIL